MKKLVVFMVALLFTVNANCQWYYKEYGVRDLNLLTTQQLEEALRHSGGITAGGGVMSVLGIFGLWGGISLINRAYDEPDWEEGLGYWFGGFFLTMFSVALETGGVMLIIVGAVRTGDIKAVLNRTEVKVGLLNIPNYRFGTEQKNNVFPGITLTCRF